jgi:hypothetical protein
MSNASEASVPDEIEVAGDVNSQSTGRSNATDEFALAPAQLDNGILNYSTKEGKRQYEKAVQYLGVKYDVSAADMRDFLEAAKEHGETQGWNTSVFAIPKDINNPQGECLHLIDSYGEISKESLKEWASTYVTYRSRAAQDSVNLYRWVRNNLSKEGISKMNRLSKSYTIDGVKSGALMIKTYTSECRADSRATVSAIRANLRNLPEYISSDDSRD